MVLCQMQIRATKGSTYKTPSFTLLSMSFGSYPNPVAILRFFHVFCVQKWLYDFLTRRPGPARYPHQPGQNARTTQGMLSTQGAEAPVQHSPRRAKLA